MVNTYFVKTFLPFSFSNLETIETDFYFKLMTRFLACGIHISRISCQTLVAERILIAMNAKVDKPPSLQRLLSRTNDYAMEIYFS